MTGVRYSLGPNIGSAEETRLPKGRRFAIVAQGRLVLRTRSNGQTFELLYRSEHQARRGLALAKSLYPDAEVYDRAGA